MAIKTKIKNEVHWRCKKCGDEIYWNTYKSMTYCKCGALGVDGCEFYPAPFEDMHFVYLIQSITKPDEIYVGSTNDLRKRLFEHNDKKSKSTARYVPWCLIYYEAFLAEDDARKREMMLKHHGKGLSELKKRLESSRKRCGVYVRLIGNEVDREEIRKPRK
ncbi:MAG: GIY-YIG nuclease family protein [Candidatus Peregrinibacteria bacterium]